MFPLKPLKCCFSIMLMIIVLLEGEPLSQYQSSGRLKQVSLNFPVFSAHWPSWCYFAWCYALFSGAADTGTFQNRCIYTEIVWQIIWHLDCTQDEYFCKALYVRRFADLFDRRSNMKNFYKISTEYNIPGTGFFMYLQIRALVFMFVKEGKVEISLVRSWRMNSRIYSYQRNIC